MAEQGIIRDAIPELVQAVLERIIVKGDGTFEVRFLDGTQLTVSELKGTCDNQRVA